MYESTLGQVTPGNPQFAVDPRYAFMPAPRGTALVKKNQSTSPIRLRVEKVTKEDKAIQVYQDVLKDKYGWKVERETKMVQTDDIELE